MCLVSRTMVTPAVRISGPRLSRIQRHYSSLELSQVCKNGFSVPHKPKHLKPHIHVKRETLEKGSTCFGKLDHIDGWNNNTEGADPDETGTLSLRRESSAPKRELRWSRRRRQVSAGAGARQPFRVPFGRRPSTGVGPPSRERPMTAGIKMRTGPEVIHPRPISHARGNVVQ